MVINNSLGEMSVDKVAICIDLGYLNKITSKFGNIPISFELLKDELIDKKTERHYRTYIYYCPPYQSSPPTPEEKSKVSRHDKFIHKLKNIPRLELRSGKLSKRGSSFIQKRVDTYCAIDLVKLSLMKYVQKVILVAGDSDFVPAIKEAKEHGVIVKLIYYPKAVHNELLECCDDKEEITQELLQKVKLIRKNRKKL